jgi:two-component system chemotaxis sensor kinase CheA
MDLAEYKDMFLSETSDHLQMLNDNLLKLEKDPGDYEALKDVFRSTHTIKGMAATMGYDGISKVSHELESTLDPYRKKKAPLDKEIIQLTFEGVDLLERLKDEVDEGKTGSVPINDFLSRLEDAKKKGAPKKAAPAKKAEPEKKEAPPKPAEKPKVEPKPVAPPKPAPAPTPKKAADELPPEVLEEKPIAKEVLEYLDMFQSEANEHLLSLNDNMLKLEKDPGDMEALASVFRSSHTIKGMSATMGFTNMSNLTHELETALDFYRKTKSALTQKMINVTFECLDKLDKLNEEINDGKVGGVGIREQLVKLKDIIEENGSWQKSLEKGGAKESKPAVKEAKPAVKDAKPAVKETKPVEPTTRPTKSKKELEKLKDKAEEKALKGTTSIRISIQNLENLMNLVGELVINKSRLVQIGQSYELSDLNEALGHIDRLTTDLQDEVLKMRMVPTRYIFNRFPRMVRDLARAEGKDIEFIIIGWDIELDRTVLDEISEPLVHLLRNSIDHGLETPDVRVKNGKTRKGTIKLVAVRAKNNVKITVEDDGKGINPEVIRQKAIEKGLVDADKAKDLTKQECINLLFLPGFSTSKKVTSVSGRGVGMDVVKTKTESLGGMIEMDSEEGKGTQTVLTLPLTMAIIRALLIRLGNETYAIPISLVVETGKISKKKVKTVKGKEVVMLRDEVVPLVSLQDMFGIERPLGEDELTIVFVERGDTKIGLVVDYLIGQQEVVIKPLGKIFQNIKGIAGATILGDGRVALILDVATLI